MNTSTEVATTLALQKFWSASLHSQAALAIAPYSKRLSKPFAEWSEQDTNHATLLQQVSHALAKHDGAEQQYIQQPANPAPLVVPTIRAAQPDDREAAIGIVRIIGLVERHNAGEIAALAGLHLAKPLFQILDLNALAATSEARKQEVLEMKHRIETGELWKSAEPINWRCLRCGAGAKGIQAFEECPCCEAPRSFATSAIF